MNAHPEISPPDAARPCHHATVFTIAIYEGLIDPAVLLQMGIYGSISATVFDIGIDEAPSIKVITADEFAR